MGPAPEVLMGCEAEAVWVPVVCDAACARSPCPQVCATPAPLQGSGRQQSGQRRLTYEGEGLPGQCSQAPFTCCAAALCMAVLCMVTLQTAVWLALRIAALCLAALHEATHGKCSSVHGSILHGNTLQ